MWFDVQYNVHVLPDSLLVQCLTESFKQVLLLFSVTFASCGIVNYQNYDVRGPQKHKCTSVLVAEILPRPLRTGQILSLSFERLTTDPFKG